MCVVRSGVSLCIQEREPTGLWEVGEPVPSSIPCPLKRRLPPLPLQITLLVKVKILVSNTLAYNSLLSINRLIIATFILYPPRSGLHSKRILGSNPDRGLLCGADIFFRFSGHWQILQKFKSFTSKLPANVCFMCEWVSWSLCYKRSGIVCRLDHASKIYTFSANFQWGIKCCSSCWLTTQTLFS